MNNLFRMFRTAPGCDASAAARRAVDCGSRFAVQRRFRSVIADRQLAIAMRDFQKEGGVTRVACASSMAVALDLTADAPARVWKQHCQPYGPSPAGLTRARRPPQATAEWPTLSIGVSGPDFNRLTDAERVFTRQRSQGCRVSWSWGPHAHRRRGLRRAGAAMYG